MVSRFANSRSPRLLLEWAVSVIIPQPSFSKVDMPIHGLHARQKPLPVVFPSPVPFVGIRLLSLATIMRGFEINDIGAQTRIRAAITVPSCSTSSGSGSEHCFASFVRIRVCCWRILPSVNNSLSLNANILDQESVYSIECSGSLPDDSGPTGNTGSSWSRLIRSCAGIARDSDSIGD
jgi:hypothetical protein